ncbi:MAG TPA: DNA-binding protein [Actinobacteria bacterium]|nr:DNA-binding protein [Actinomycetota bacterium]
MPRRGVLANEKPWTPKELADVQAELLADRDRLAAELAATESGIADLVRDSGDGAGDDVADAGSKTFEREQEMSIADNARDLLLQTDKALGRIEAGTYGTCESCGGPIGKARLQAFPRATLCLECKQAEERS